MFNTTPGRAALLAAPLLLTTAMAQADTGTPPRDVYVGTTAGVVVVKPDHHDIDRHRDGDGRLSPGLFVGLKLGALPIGSGMPVAVEAGYQHIARHRLGYKVDGQAVDLTAHGHSSYVAAKVDFLSFGGLSFYGRLGLARNSVGGSTPAGGPALDIGGSHTGALLGLGLQYAFNDQWSLRGEVTSYGKSSRNSEARGLGVGVAYAF